MVNDHAIVPVQGCPVWHMVYPILGGLNVFVCPEEHLVPHDYRAERIRLVLYNDEIDYAARSTIFWEDHL